MAQSTEVVISGHSHIFEGYLRQKIWWFALNRVRAEYPDSFGTNALRFDIDKGVIKKHEYKSLDQRQSDNKISICKTL